MDEQQPTKLWHVGSNPIAGTVAVPDMVMALTVNQVQDGFESLPPHVNILGEKRATNKDAEFGERMKPVPIGSLRSGQSFRLSEGSRGKHDYYGAATVEGQTWVYVGLRGPGGRSQPFSAPENPDDEWLVYPVEEA